MNKKFKFYFLSVLLTLFYLNGSSQAIYFSDDFEDYNVNQQVACQNTDNWTTWNEDPCNTTEDPYISETYYHTSTKSVNITDDNDLVYPINNYTEGYYEISFYMYLPSGKDGYWNILQDFDSDYSKWGMQVNYNQYYYGEAEVDAGGYGAATFNFSFDTWMFNKVIIDLDNDTAILIVDNDTIVGWKWSSGADGEGNTKQLGAVDFYGYTGGLNGTSNYYIDDFKYFNYIAPHDLATKRVAENDIKLGWTEPGTVYGNRIKWQVEYGNEGFTHGSGTTKIFRKHSSKILTGLDVNQKYDWYVRSIYGNDTSEWSDKNSFILANVTWNGNGDDWTNPANWDPNLGQKPNKNTKVDIPANTSNKYPNINSGETVHWYGLTVESNARIQVDDGKLEINSPISNSGNISVGRIDSNGGAVSWGKLKTYYGFTNNNTGNIHIMNGLMVVNKDFTNDGYITVDDRGRLRTVGLFTNNNSLKIKSLPKGSGNFITGTFTGNDIEANLYVKGGRWNFITPFLTGNNNTAQNLMDTDPDNDSWLTWFNEEEGTGNEEGTGWHYITNTNTILNFGQGYAYWPINDEILTFTGGVKTDDCILPLSFTDSQHGYNFIGNPYPSALHWDSTWNLTNVDGVLYIFTKRSGYKEHPINLETGYNIKMGQGFFVRATSTDANITIPSGKRVFGNSIIENKSKGKNGKWEYNFITIAAFNNNYTDSVYVYFDEKGTDEYDWGYDAVKMFGTPDSPQIYLKEGDKKQAYDFLPDLQDNDSRTVQLGYIPGTDGYQKLSFDLSKFKNIDVILEDLSTGKFQNLSENSVYEFTGYKNDNPERFVLHFTKGVTGIEQNIQDQDEIGIKIYSYSKNIYVQLDKEISKEQGKVFVYDITGKKLLSAYIQKGDTFKRLPINNYSGYVIVKVIEGTFIKTSKVFVK